MTVGVRHNGLIIDNCRRFDANNNDMTLQAGGREASRLAL